MGQRHNPAITHCRSLDAIHLATALLFKSNLDEPLQMGTLDQGLRKTAVELGFELFSENDQSRI